MEKNSDNKSFSLKTLTKSSVWDVQENDIFRMWESAEKDSEVHDNVRHYVDIIRSAFVIEEINNEAPAIKTNMKNRDIRSARSNWTRTTR